MSVYTAREIYRFARLAGFSPDEAVTMTAIALAESGGRSSAHNPRGEDSRGLWQINAASHPTMAHRNLYDPVVNAKAAFKISAGGKDISPWTTTHGGSSAPYVAYQSEAVAAAKASGDVADGVFTGTTGYGDSLSASSTGTPTQDSGALNTFLQSALAQKGDPYVWGDEAAASDPDPDSFDCSELVQWSAARAGVALPDGSWLQFLDLKNKGLAISPEEAAKTPGALLFSFSSEPTAGGGRPSQAHVAISRGNGRTIEAASPSSGVTSLEVGNRFQYAAVIPGISDGTGGSKRLSGADSDGDMISDSREQSMGLSKNSIDSDSDNASDIYELSVLHTNPAKADSDGDHVIDSMELLDGTSPTDPDSDLDGRLDGTRELRPKDTDGDHITDALERLLGTNIGKTDSDADGFDDFGEYHGKFDPTDPDSNPVAPVADDPAAGAAGTEPGADDDQDLSSGQ